MNIDLGISPTFHSAPKPQPIVVGERCELPGASEIVLLEGNAADVEITPNGVRFGAPGRYRLRVSGGLRTVVAELVAVSPELKDRIPVDETKLSVGESAEGRRAGVLRALCQEPRFTGAGLEGFRLTDYGADNPPPRGVVRRT